MISLPHSVKHSCVLTGSDRRMLPRQDIGPNTTLRATQGPQNLPAQHPLMMEEIMQHYGGLSSYLFTNPVESVRGH